MEFYLRTRLLTYLHFRYKIHAITNKLSQRSTLLTESYMRKKLLLIVSAILLATCVLSACKKESELQGSVFIVTQGAENYKLGLVKITSMPESEIT